MHSFASRSKRDNGEASWAETSDKEQRTWRVSASISDRRLRKPSSRTSGAIAFKLVIPTGFSSVEVAEQVRRAFSCEGFEMDEMPVVATGYGRVAVPYANKVVTEITCHARGAAALFGEDGTVIDIGGQDTKAIGLAGGKCASSS